MLLCSAAFGPRKDKPDFTLPGPRKDTAILISKRPPARTRAPAPARIRLISTSRPPRRADTVKLQVAPAQRRTRCILTPLERGSQETLRDKALTIKPGRSEKCRFCQQPRLIRRNAKNEKLHRWM